MIFNAHGNLASFGGIREVHSESGAQLTNALLSSLLIHIVLFLLPARIRDTVQSFLQFKRSTFRLLFDEGLAKSDALRSGLA